MAARKQLEESHDIMKEEAGTAASGWKSHIYVHRVHHKVFNTLQDVSQSDTAAYVGMFQR